MNYVKIWISFEEYNALLRFTSEQSDYGLYLEFFNFVSRHLCYSPNFYSLQVRRIYISWRDSWGLTPCYMNAYFFFLPFRNEYPFLAFLALMSNSQIYKNSRIVCTCLPLWLLDSNGNTAKESADSYLSATSAHRWTFKRILQHSFFPTTQNF